MHEHPYRTIEFRPGEFVTMPSPLTDLFDEPPEPEPYAWPWRVRGWPRFLAEIVLGSAIGAVLGLLLT